MKKLSYLIILTLILGLVLTGCLLSNVGQVPTTERKPNEIAEGIFEVGALVAGKDFEVGTVIVSNDTENLYVKYLITAPNWCLTETHLHVAESWEVIPQKNGNPIPGKFDYKLEHDCVKEYTYEVPWVLEPCTKLFIAAHAVVENTAYCESFGTVYGVEQVSGDLYEIDVVGSTATKIADIVDPVPENKNSPNGLAWDPTTDRLYFSAHIPTDTSSVLWFWEGGTTFLAGEIPGVATGATFFESEYYYVKNATDDLVKVQFSTDGTVDGVFNVVADFAGNDTFRFGDIVIYPEGPILYGSTNQSGLTPPTFFSIDSMGYNSISTTDGIKLQLAVGSDGVLYGQSTGSGKFFMIDPATGTTTPAGKTVGAEYGFTDLASGTRCVPPTETAWAAGSGFPGKNWATYFHYIVNGVPIIIDGILSSGEWDCATEIPVAGVMGTVRVSATTDYLYVAFDVLDSTDARLGENIHGNDQTSINVNPTDGAPWGKPCDIIFQIGADPNAWGGTSSGQTDGWKTDWEINGVQQLSLPGDLETMTIFYSGGNRISEWKVPLASIAPSAGDDLKVGGAIDVGDGASYVYPIGLDPLWKDASTYVDIYVY